MTTEVLFRAVRHRMLVLAGLGVVDCVSLRLDSEVQTSDNLIID